MKRLLSLTVVATIVATLLSGAEVRADGKPPADPFVILLQGVYQPAERGPNLGLAHVNLNSGSYSTVQVYRVDGLPGTSEPAIGNFWSGPFAVYQLPGGAIASLYTEFLFDVVEIDGEIYEIGTAELIITDATGIYRPFVNGSIHMEFISRVIAPGVYDEYCLCFISR